MIVIKNEKVELFPEETKKIVTLDGFIESLGGLSGMHIPLLPDHCVGFFAENERTCFVIEQQPRLCNMNFYLQGETWNFKIALPWIYYFVSIQNMPIIIRNVHMMFGNKRVTSEDSELFHIPFPNVINGGDRVGKLCLGEIRMDSDLLMHQCINDLIAKITFSCYNKDYFFITRSPIFIHDLLDTTKLTPEREEQLSSMQSDSYYNIFKYLSVWEALSATTELKEMVKKFNQNPFSYKYIQEKIISWL